MWQYLPIWDSVWIGDRIYIKFIEYAKKLNENILTAFIIVGMSEGLFTKNRANIVWGNIVNSNVKNIPKLIAIFKDLFTT